jgi:uncharacterized protein involved in outer membrane biogenesis
VVTRKIAIGVLVVLLLMWLVGFFWVRSMFARDAVRAALASQISSAIGQPVSIDSIGVSIFPRIAVRLSGVSIGRPPRIQAKSLRLATDFGALLSRKIVHGTVHLDGARVEFPLPPFGSTSASTPEQHGRAWPLEIVSIDEIVLNNVEVVSGGRTLRGDFGIIPHGAGATLRKISLVADDTSITGTGEIKNLAAPVGEISLKAGTLNLTRLLDFLSAFSSRSGMSARTTSLPAARTPPTDLTVMFSADHATMGALRLEKISGRARVTQQNVTLSPIEFGVFDGSYKGTMVLSPNPSPIFRSAAVFSNIDVAALTASAGSPGVLSGRLSGRMELAAQGADPSGALNSARGTARVDIQNGVVKGLGLVKTIVIATSMRADARSTGRASSNEPFSQLGATLVIGNGTAHTSDLRFQSPDVLMNAAGSFQLNGSAIDLKGNVQLSDALSQQAGRDLLRYTQEQGRVTLPVTITGPAGAPAVQIDVANLAGRALQNKAKETINKALGDLFRR